MTNAHEPVWKMVTAKDKFSFWFKRFNVSVFAGHVRPGQRSVGLIRCEQWICSTDMRFHTHCARFVWLKLRWRCHDLDNSGICVSCIDLRTELCQNHDAGSQVVVVLGVWYSDEEQWDNWEITRKNVASDQQCAEINGFKEMVSGILFSQHSTFVQRCLC